MDDLRFINELSDHVLERVRSEYTVMPRFGYHQPLDYLDVTEPVIYDESVLNEELSELPIPGNDARFGYAIDNEKEYIRWGKDDSILIKDVINKYLPNKKSDLSILDFGCSSGRVLRHFNSEYLKHNWSLFGCDVQARAIQWMRQNFPSYFNVMNSSTLPHLPYEDNTFDVIYGFSVFTHIKYQWDAWLLELKRILKPRGLLLQTIHAENAWSFYYQHRNENWVRENLTSRVYDNPLMDVDYLYHGDASVSQVFWKKEIAIEYWSRYLTFLEHKEPPERSFQDWLIFKK
ncbi:class I SAM-dependent methyltransferase [Endozoicomonas sp. 2B-B]